MRAFWVLAYGVALAVAVTALGCNDSARRNWQPPAEEPPEELPLDEDQELEGS